MLRIQLTIWVPVSCLSLLLFANTDLPPSGSAEENALCVTIDSGTLEGARYGSDVDMFLGVPYAAPPTGNLRWSPPAPPAQWTGVRKANAFGPVCPQSEDGIRRINAYAQEYAPLYPFYGTFRPDEDCLSLNVWTKRAEGKARLPVMVWIHGGGGNSGTGAGPPLGPQLAGKGVVLVAPNFRIGLLGRMAHPGLTDESPHHSSGNYTTLDQIAALQWIRRNIEEFGGDRNNITIFGGSDGALQVCYLMISPLAHGLFHRAIMQSDECRDSFVPELDRRVDWDAGHGGSAHDVGLRLAGDLKITDGPSGLAQMRARSWQEIVDASEQDEHLADYAATVDGWVLPEQPAIAFHHGHEARVPVMLGSTEDEWVLLYSPPGDPSAVGTYKEWLKKERFFSHAEELFQAYPAKTDADVRRSFLDLATDDTAQGAYHFARDMTEARQKAFLYYFTYPEKGKYAGYPAHHGLELNFLAGVFSQSRWGEPNDEDKKLVEIMGGYWTQFAKTGDPNHKGLPTWPVYDPQKDVYLEIGRKIKVRPIHHLEKFALFERSLQTRVAEYEKSGSTEKR